MKNEIIVRARNLIFDLQKKNKIVAWPLVFCWKGFDGVKFFLEKTSLQLKARLRPGPNQLRKEILVFFSGKKAYQPLILSTLSDIPYHQGSELRYKIIKENLGVKSGSLLDIGANLGYFCHKLEEDGFDCYALEENRILCYFAEKIKRAAGQKFKIIPQSIFEYQQNKDLDFDVILALSVFHNLLAREDLYFNLLRLLKRLKAKELFFETYLPSEFKEGEYYKNYTPQEFVGFIMENSCFTKAEFIGQSEEGRPLYKLTP